MLSFSDWPGRPMQTRRRGVGRPVGWRRANKPRGVHRRAGRSKFPPPVGRTAGGARRLQGRSPRAPRKSVRVGETAPDLWPERTNVEVGVRQPEPALGLGMEHGQAVPAPDSIEPLLASLGPTSADDSEGVEGCFLAGERPESPGQVHLSFYQPVTKVVRKPAVGNARRGD